MNSTAPFHFDPALTDSQIQSMEAAYAGNAKSFGVTRRAALALLTLGAGDLRESIKADPVAAEAFVSTLEGLNGYITTLAAVQETMEAACARLLIVLGDIETEPAETAEQAPA